MSKFKDINTYPFTKEQLRFFRREIERAGGTDELMIEKEALKTDKGSREIVVCKNMAEYKEKFLVGVYEPLREHLTTNIPYVFWSKLYTSLRKVNPKVK